MRKAFTLIELLVVIAIIALLVSILVPSLRTARELARRAVCATNEHGMGTGIQMYAADNNDSLPYIIGDMSPPNNGPNAHTWSPGFRRWEWADFIIQYFDTTARPAMTSYANCNFISVANQPASGNYCQNLPIVLSQRMRCPSQKLLGGKDYPSGSIDPNRPYGYDHYAYNGNISWPANADLWDNPPGTSGSAPIRPPPPMKTSKVNCGTIAGVIEPPFAYTTFNYGVASQYAMWVPHLGTSNVGFLDSHVVTVTQQFILSGCKDWQGNPSDGWKPGLAPFKLPS